MAYYYIRTSEQMAFKSTQSGSMSSEKKVGGDEHPHPPFFRGTSSLNNYSLKQKGCPGWDSLIKSK
jgi:hypothetical protein